jgi:hypothetical protein
MVVGPQLVAKFQSPEPGDVFHVALPARVGCELNSTSAATPNAGLQIRPKKIRSTLKSAILGFVFI